MGMTGRGRRNVLSSPRGVMKHNCLLVVAVVFVAACPAYADEASKMAKAEEYLRLAKIDETLQRSMELTMNQMRSGMIQQVTGVKVPAGQEKAFAEFQDKLQAILSEAFAWEKLKPDFVKLIAQTYTETELDGLIDFYKSPTGQAMVAKSPELMKKGSELGRQRVIEAAPQLQKLLRDFVASQATPQRQQ